jgi:hypothetical protein
VAGCWFHHSPKLNSFCLVAGCCEACGQRLTCGQGGGNAWRFPRLVHRGPRWRGQPLAYPAVQKSGAAAVVLASEYRALRSQLGELRRVSRNKDLEERDPARGAQSGSAKTAVALVLAGTGRCAMNFSDIWGGASETGRAGDCHTTSGPRSPATTGPGTARRDQA